MRNRKNDLSIRRLENNSKNYQGDFNILKVTFNRGFQNGYQNTRQTQLVTKNVTKYLKTFFY